MTNFKPINQDNTVYPCVQCGSENVKIIRSDAQNPRCRCGSCGFVFNGADSLAAEKAGAIKASSAESLASAEEPTSKTYEPGAIEEAEKTMTEYLQTPYATLVEDAGLRIPRTPSFVFLSKDRRRYEFCTKKTLKRTAMKWELTGPYDVFELAAKKFDLKFDIS